MSSTIVIKGIIPAAGLGTRVRTIAGDLPKELLTVAAKPLIVHAIEGLAASGIRQIGIVLSPAKESIRQFLLGEPPEFLAPQLDAHLRVLLRACTFSFFVQPSPLGVADAVSLCRDFVDDEPFALVMPDNILLDSLPVVSQMIPFFSREPRDMVGALRLKAEQASRFGNVGLLETEAFSAESKRLLSVSSFSDKVSDPLHIPAGDSVLKNFGGGIFLPHFFDYIEKLRPHIEGELDDVPVVQAIMQEKGLLAVALEGNGFDVGNSAGYWAANLHIESKQLLLQNL
ncbi:MAG: 2-C-methyl-D-erythritol 4-phosphate cytidylyltransferase [Deltaproteobacteria bacterium]|nr:2-C-methyl-D-erythritol 4-phosphate cytidylyltransferase [Deltaproteobacteria bacterium]